MRKNQNESAPKHLFIENPYTGKQVNILPFLKLSNDDCFSGFNSGGRSIYSAIDNTIRKLNTVLIEEAFFHEVRYLTDSLYELRDAIGNMVELKTTGHGRH